MKGTPNERGPLGAPPWLALKWVGSSWLGTVMTFGAKLILWQALVSASRNRIFQPPKCLLVDFALEPLGLPQLSQPVVPALCSPEQRLQPCDPQVTTYGTRRGCPTRLGV